MAKNPIMEHTPERLVVRLGGIFPHGSTCVLDKATGRARFERRLFFWPRKPIEVALGDISAFEIVETSTENESSYYPRVTLCSGKRFYLSDAGNLETTREMARQVREFLGLAKQ
jgi:hypothetical protein